jgi:hypothetical protein
MSYAALQTVREARRNFRQWLDETRQSPDPASQPRGAMKGLATNLNRVEVVLRDLSANVSGSDEWKKEIAQYTETLRELRARLRNFEITLQIRNVQMAKKRAHLGVVHCWADLAKNIG